MRSYLDSFQTTIGKTVYVTADWDDWDPDRRYVTLRHEAVHLRQFRKFTLPGMAVLYVLLPLPMGLAWFRAYFEKEAYAESDPRRRRGLGPGLSEAARVPRIRDRPVHGPVVRLDVAVSGGPRTLVRPNPGDAR